MMEMNRGQRADEAPPAIIIRGSGGRGDGCVFNGFSLGGELGSLNGCFWFHVPKPCSNVVAVVVVVVTWPMGSNSEVNLAL